MKVTAANSPGSGSGARTRGPFVGRRAEQDQLASALADARSGRGSLFLIQGDAGIGKTSLVTAVAADAADQGFTVLWGSAWEAGGAPAFWPWIQVIRELVQSRPSEEVVEDLGGGLAIVAQIAPELPARLGMGVEPAPSLDNEAARFAAFDATASFMRAAAARRQIMLVLDDVHAADVATVRLLEFLARSIHRARLLAVCTSRPDLARTEPETAAALASLAPAARRITLGGLSCDEVVELATSQAASPLPDELVERVHGLTEGNPFFVDEVLRLVTAEAGAPRRFAQASGRLPVPDAVRDTIRLRLEPLSADIVGTLEAASVIGPEFGLETLARVVGDDRARLLTHLDTAAALGLVVGVPHDVGRQRFAHALIRETLYDGLSAGRRVALHAATGEVLLDLYGTRVDAPLSELAHHFLQAAPAGNAARASDLAARAAEQALKSMAYEQAIALFGHALWALELDPREPHRRGEILLAMGQAEIRAGGLDAGRATLRRAIEEARRLGDGELLARAAVAWAPWGLATAMSDEEEQMPLLKEALERLPDVDSALRARVLARLSATLYWRAPAERRRDLAGDAIAMARRAGDPSTLAYVLSDAHLATWDPDSPERSLPWASEIAALAERLGNMELALAAHSWRISLLLELGQWPVVDHEIQTFAGTAARLHQLRAQAQSRLHRSARALIAGHFDEAESCMAEAVEYAGRLPQDRILGMRIAALAFVMYEIQGRLPELEAGVRQFADDNPAMPVWRCGLLSVYLQAGREAEAEREYERLSAAGFDTLPRDNLWLPAVALLAEACAQLRDAAGARRIRELLERYAGRNVVTPDVAYIGPVDRYLALLAATEGDVEAAAHWLASATALAGSMGAKPTCVRLALDEARLLLGVEPRRSAALAARAASEAELLGLAWLAEQARSVEREASAASHAPPAHAAAAAPPPPEPRRRAGRLHRRGDFWEIAGSGAAFHLKDTKGLRHLARLLDHPGQEFHALDLVAPAAPGPLSASAVDASLSVRGRGQDSAGPALDARAKADYARRIAELEEEIEQAEAFHDPERASRCREEYDVLMSELSAAVGLGGRDRRTGADAERARVNVTRTLGTAIERIAAHDPLMGHHLRTCVRTGTFCSYEPGPDGWTWDVSAAG